MEFLDETHTTRWASVCVFSNILLILLALASSVLESKLDDVILPLLIPQSLLIAPLLLQLLCLAVFTFSARSGSLQLFKYQLQIPFLGRWMLPVIVLVLSTICLGILSRGLISTRSNSVPVDLRPFFFIITLAQLVLHFLHLLNLGWGSLHYLWAPRPTHYQPIHSPKQTSEIELNKRSPTSSGHLSEAYLRLSKRRNRTASQTEEVRQVPSASALQIQANNSLDLNPSDDIGQAEVNGYDDSLQKSASCLQKACLTTAQLVRFSKKSNTWHAWHLWFLWELTILLGVAIFVSMFATLWMVALVQLEQRATGDKKDHRVTKRAAFTAILSPAGGLLTISSTWWLLTRGGHFLDGERHHLLQLTRRGTASTFKVGDKLTSTLPAPRSSTLNSNPAKPTSEHNSSDEHTVPEKWPCPHFKHRESKTHRRNILIVISSLLLVGVLASLAGIGSALYSATQLQARVGDLESNSWLPEILYFLDFVSSIWISGASLVLVLFLWFFR